MSRRTPPKSRTVRPERPPVSVPRTQRQDEPATGPSSHLGGQFGFAPPQRRDWTRPGQVRL